MQKVLKDLTFGGDLVIPTWFMNILKAPLTREELY